MSIDQTKLEEFQGPAVAEAAAAESAACCYIGDVLGLDEAIDGAGPLTPAELAARSHTHERCVREWRADQAWGGYVTYHAEDGDRVAFEVAPAEGFGGRSSVRDAPRRPLRSRGPAGFAVPAGYRAPTAPRRAQGDGS